MGPWAKSGACDVGAGKELTCHPHHYCSCFFYSPLEWGLCMFFFFFSYHLQHNKLLIVSDLNICIKWILPLMLQLLFALSFSPDFMYIYTFLPFSQVKILLSPKYMMITFKIQMDNNSFSSVAQSCPTLCDPMNRSTPGLPVHHQLPEFTQIPRPSSQWCHRAISSSVVPFFCPQSLPASGSFPMSQLLTWGGQSTGVSALASFLPKKSQG